MQDKGRKYMSKRSRACDACRARKAACRIDTTPPCYLCSLHGKECTFVNPTFRPRRLPRKEDGMERSQILAFSDDLTLGDNHMDHANSSDASPGIQPSLDAFQTFFDEQTLLPNYLGDELWPTGLSPRGFTYHSPDAPTNQPGVETAQHHQQVNRPVDISDTRQTACLDDANDAATASLLGSSGDMDPLVLQHYQYDSSGRFRFKNLEVQSVAAMGPPVQFILSQPSIFTSTREETGSYETPPQVLRDELESVVPKDIGIRIIDLFKRIVPPHYPIFTSSDPLTPDITPASLLASIYLISEPFTKFDERLCIDLAYEKPSSAMLYRIINKALAYQVHAPTLETLQAMLLLVLRPHPSPIVLDSGFKWNQLATVVACAQSLGLHLDPSAWKIPAAQIAQRRRVSCCVYSVDKWLALSLGRPPLLNHDTWLVTAPGLEDRIGSGLDSSKWERVMQRGELTVLLDRVLTQLYSPRALHTLFTNNESISSSAESLLDALTSWRHNISTTHPTEPNKPASLDRVLEMEYHYIHLSISRAILRPFLSLNTTINPLTNTQARTKAKSCILASASFIHDLYPSDLETLWPAWSSTAFSSVCFHILLMVITALDEDEAVYWADCLRRVRRDMRLKAEVLPCLRLGLLRIDSIFWKGPERVLHLGDHVLRAFGVVK